MRFKVSRYFFLFLSLVLLSFWGLDVGFNSLPARADSLHLSIFEGQQYEVCKSLELALNSEIITSKESFWCNIPDLLEEPRYSHPVWTEVDIANNLELAREIFLRRWLGSRFRNLDELEEFWELRKDLFESEVSQGIMRIERSYFDWNYDGDNDRIYRYTRRVCSEDREALTFGSTGSYHILERDDPVLAEATLGRFRKSTNAFFLRDRTYFLSFTSKGAIVYEPRTLLPSSRLAMVPLCILRWENN